MYFLNGSHFSKFLYVALLSTWLNLEPSYLTQLCIYTWGYLQGRNYASINNILKVMNFLKNSYFALFVSFDIHAKNTDFTFGIPHTHTHTHTHTHIYRYTQTHTDTIFTFCTFWLIWYTCQIYLAYHRLTHAQILRHMYRDIDTQIQIH